MRITPSTRLAPALLVPLAALGLTSMAAPAPAAAATCSATTISGTEVRDPQLVVGIKNTRTIDLLAEVKDSCTVARVDMTIRSPQGAQTFRADKLEGYGGYSYWLVSIGLTADSLSNVEAGAWSSSVTAKGSTTATKAGPKFQVLRNARASLNVRPEPVRKGQKLTFTGKVERANWETKRYVGYPSRTVDLQWRAAGSKTYISIKKVKTGTKGAVTTAHKATKDGCYRIVFRGSPVTGGSTSKPDCVDVR